MAAALGIPCHVVDRDDWRSASLAEVPFIACSGSVGDLAFKSAESHLQGSVLLSGPSGDTIWDKNTIFSPRMTIGEGSMLGFTEYRLWAGFINCPVPFWGVRQIFDIVRLSNSIEMEPWNIGGDYNRPVCRRIIETAGVPRALFGVSKRGMSVVPSSRRDFLTPASREDFLAWLGEQRKQHPGKQVSLPNPVLARFFDLNMAFLSACVRVLDKFRYRRGFKWSASLVDFIRARLKRAYYHHHYTVHWAIDRAKRRYRYSSDNEKSESMNL
ncbi:hypothetical protein MNBD_GAMMA14-2188 [hydrothermal vent metagenome]|uniref:Uncharacterized protein n=1 Tax=hydrothermal vent metagenome TaxID=652676 RepID=A0A3B0YAF4_9ZZZZ